jgi:hypothetical protein
MRFRLKSALLIYVALPLAGCAHTAGASSETGASRPHSRSVPEELLRFESATEDAFDGALTVGGSLETMQASQLHASWPAVRAALVRDEVEESLIVQLGERVAAIAVIPSSVPRARLARLLNAVSEPLDRVFTAYSHGAEPLLLRLDNLGRELLLDGLEARWDLAEQHMRAVNATWSTVLENPKANPSLREVIAFGARLERVRYATQRRAARELEHQARGLLEDVDRLESLLLTSR